MTYTVVNVRINGSHYLPLGVFTIGDAPPKTVAACHVASLFGRRVIQKEGAWT